MLVAPRDASAQVHWDAGANAGIVRRIYTGGAGGGGFGPMAGIQGHVALFPLVRLGGYFSHDLSPADDGGPARNVTSFGVRVKVGSPWPRGALHAWAFLGLGYAEVYARSYHRSVGVGDGGSPVFADALVAGASARHLDVPFGIGIGYRFWKPWELTLEVGSHFGLDFVGSLYEEPGRAAFPAGYAERRIAPVGTDAVAPFAVLGVSLDE
ncbi:MAG TPA: hypothetical protein VNO21_16640 [Polyangiaceae bacterium]|nr:hypothetical protein [Polyangiaceae bacterium]